MEKHKDPNRSLWQARKRSGLSRKAVSHLLGRSFTDDLSRYESGQRIPLLSTALKLEAIYSVPVRLLFYRMYQSALWQVRERSGKFDKYPLQGPGPKDHAHFGEEQYCTYAELLKTPNLPDAEKQNIYSHIRYMAKAINEVEGINDGKEKDEKDE